jgi:hypothetical protein
MGQISHKLKKVIFNKLYKDLSHAEIILDNHESIWFIDRENKYWYLEFKKGGVLLWRYKFFTIFFELFSMESSEFQWIISEWVEEVLNRKVDSTTSCGRIFSFQVEEVLNRKVILTTVEKPISNVSRVEEVLKLK